MIKYKAACFTDLFTNKKTLKLSLYNPFIKKGNIYYSIYNKH